MHKSTIRLAETARGAGFIRDRARAAQQVLRAELPRLPTTLVHSDWGVKNARFRRKRVVAVFDWDSLAAMAEAQMVGQAAAQFTANWDIPTRIAPTPAEAGAFVEEYLEARGRRFSKTERAVASAAADWLMSVVARQEWAQRSTSDNTFLALLRQLGKRPLLR